MTESPTRARRRRTPETDDGGSVWLERLWALLARPVFVGATLIVAGIVVMLAPTATVPASPSQGWWIAAYRFSNASQGAVTLLIAATFLAVAVAWQGIATRKRAHRIAPMFAIGLMVAGVLSGLLTWFVGQADVPTSRIAVAPGQTIEAYPAIESGRAFKVMLPTRIFVSAVDVQQGKASIELRKPNEETGLPNDVYVGDPLEVAGFRLALIGLELDPSARSAVLAMDGGIEQRASVKSKVRFMPDGPEYLVRNIIPNYLGVMGPAAELVGPDDDVFWVTQRDGTLPEPLSEIRLKRIEAAPVPVFALTKTAAGEAAPAAALLFVLGLGLFLFSRERGAQSLAELGPSLEDA